METNKTHPLPVRETSPDAAAPGPSGEYIVLEGVHQNTLKGFDLSIPLGTFTVVTGVSGSGKSSLAFDTIYAEGQRRYVETFSPYTRQFLSRMDRPRVDRITGIPPAIAIDQTNPVRTSRSTVGTMTELADHLKLLFARASTLYCRSCSRAVRRDTPETVLEELDRKFASESERSRRILVAFPVRVPESLGDDELHEYLVRLGYERTLRREGGALHVIQDRVVYSDENRRRIAEDVETAMRFGSGAVSIHPVDRDGREETVWRFSSGLHCPDCDISYRAPVPNMFSFNSPIGACETCRGFGRTIGIDYGLVIPDETLSLKDGAVKPWRTASYRECQDEKAGFAKKRGIRLDVPWKDLSEDERRWVLEGEGRWEDGKWYGVSRFFEWLETKSYKMHIRVLLSKYRSYGLCPACNGARLKPEALLYRIGVEKFSIRDVTLLPIEEAARFFDRLELPAPLDEATVMLLDEIRRRFSYLVDVGLGYLTLDRQSRALSGGEVQRINLTTALGTSLVNTLFILDEPSIGLHPRDIGRLITILTRLRDAGNTILVVEHDPDVIRAADLVIDMGPGAGERGGEIVFYGPYRELLRSERSLTGMYLSGAKRVTGGMNGNGAYGSSAEGDADGNGQLGHGRTGTDADTVLILGAAEHNLRNIDVSIPLGMLVSVTGVSGSGKSTLLDEVLYRGLLKLKHKPVEQPGKHGAILGHERVHEVVFVDQSPIGKTARSNPASYVGAYDAIRKIFARAPLAVERGYTAGTFSFNAGNGRCPTCKGTGFEHIEMQFLSDVYLRCPDCNGTRFRREVLEVKLPPSGSDSATLGADRKDAADSRDVPSESRDRGDPVQDREKSIADVLGMTVSEACAFFSGHPEVEQGLKPLIAVGLEYLTLGRPVPTLSGGEAQRLKLAGFLAETWMKRTAKKSTLFLFDEPTTGLHFEDIEVLLRAFRELIRAGHSVVVIEHNLDVIGSSDWIIDLGPEGGERGGRLVAEGTPLDVAKNGVGHTALALRRHLGLMEAAEAASPAYAALHAHDGNGIEVLPMRHDGNDIVIRRAREHNLKNIDLTIPRDSFTVVTGVSGSGKSTLAFDILFSEGQRRYLESLNAYARQFVQPAAKPDVDLVSGVPPTVAIEQRTSRGGRKSTLATMTEVYHFLRLLFVKLGVQHCPDCGIPIEPQSRDVILSRLLSDRRGARASFYAPLVIARKGYYTDLAAWAKQKGFAELRVDGVLTPVEPWPRLDRYQEHSIELPIGETTLTPENEREAAGLLDEGLRYGKGSVRVAFDSGTEESFSTTRACPRCGRSFDELDPRLFSFNSKHGWCRRCYGTGLQLSGFDEEQTGEETIWNEWWEGAETPCPDCLGARLRPEALAVKFRGRSISEFSALSVEKAETEFRTLELGPREREVARDIMSELLGRLEFLREVGLGYLSLDRAAPTLSGGEAQRIRLAAQLGSNLRGVCYVLDEPTIGLHPRDNRMLLSTLRRLKAKGNTVVVVEHDEETIRQAEYLVDLGPGGGVNGGHVVAAGSPESVFERPESLTGLFMRRPLRHPLSGSRRPEPDEWLVVRGASLHNLKNQTVRIPLARLSVVTGVSGSGKSTLVRNIVHDNMRSLVGRNRGAYGRRTGKSGTDEGTRLVGCEAIDGSERVERVLEVDQTPIGKTPRSCPATYVGFWDEIRALFALTPEAKMKGYAANRFSFNVSGGRCEGCAGQGVTRIEMSFLPDVTVPCEVCGGTRFNDETLEVRFKDRTIAEVLAMSVDEAVEFFSAHPKIRYPLSLLRDVGLGYLTLGQQSPTLSGGEAQRIKLVTELARVRPEGAFAAHCLYLLDEPTVGLHMADVEKLIRVLQRLVDAGGTVLVIEHNLDVIAEADRIIDLGPEGGENGGTVTVEGTPEEVAETETHTGRILKPFLAGRSDAVQS